jgi:hypothetical protein
MNVALIGQCLADPSLSVDWAAFWTMGATLVALAVAMRDVLIRAADRKRRRSLAATALFHWVETTTHRSKSLADALNVNGVWTVDAASLRDLAGILRLTSARDSSRILEQAAHLDLASATILVHVDSVLTAIDELLDMIAGDITDGITPNPESLSGALEGLRDDVDEIAPLLEALKKRLHKAIPKKIALGKAE